MDDKEILFGLMAVAEEQQKAIDKALHQLKEVIDQTNGMMSDSFSEIEKQAEIAGQEVHASLMSATYRLVREIDHTRETLESFAERKLGYYKTLVITSLFLTSISTLTFFGILFFIFKR